MKSLIFLSSHNRYLEHQVYCQLAKSLRSTVKCIYLESDYSKEITYYISSDRDKQELITNFDELASIKPIQNVPKNKILGIIDNVLNIRKWSDSLINKVKTIKPSAFIFTSPNETNFKLLDANFPQIPKFFIQAAAKRKTHHTQLPKNSFLSKMGNDLIYKIPFDRFYKHDLSNLKNCEILVWGEKWKEQLDLPAKHIHIVGNCELDRVSTRSLKGKKIKKIGIILNKESNIGIDKWNVFASFYKKMIQDFGEFQFKIKPHPKSCVTNLKKCFSEESLTFKTEDIEESDLILSHWSSLIYKMLKIRIPTILVNPNNAFDYHDFFLEDYPFFANNIKDIKTHIEDFNRDTNHFNEVIQTFNKQMTFKMDGNSSIRAAQIIMERIESA